jgi:hypothetical protein
MFTWKSYSLNWQGIHNFVSALRALALNITGTAGDGFIQLPLQTVDPAAADANYTFVIPSSSITAGTVYTNNGATFTVINTTSSSTALLCYGTGGVPAASGTLTFVSGSPSGDLTFSSVASSAQTSRLFPDANGQWWKVDSSGNKAAIGGGSGSGKNYLSAIFDASAPVGTISTGVSFAVGQTRAVPTQWAASDVTKLTVTKVTSGQLEGDASYQLTHVGAGADVSIQTPLFSLDLIDVGVAQNIKFDVSGVVTSGDYDIFVDRYNSSNVLQATISCAGTVSSGGSALIPVGTGRFSSFFVPGSVVATDKFALRFHRILATTYSVLLDELSVGPNVQVQGSAIGAWKSYTPTISNLSTSSTAANYREVGSSLEIAITATSNAVASGNVSFPLPSGFTINTSALPVTNINQTLGTALLNPAVGNIYTGVVVYLSSTSVAVWSSNTSSLWNATIPVVAASGSAWTVKFLVPVNELSSNVTLANRAVEEYASNSSATDADTTSSGFVNGPDGSAGIVGVTSITATRAKYVRFQSTIQKTDKIEIEFADPTTGVWIKQSQNQLVSLGTQKLCIPSMCSVASPVSATTTAGIGFVVVNQTDIAVLFGRYSASDYSSSSLPDWSATFIPAGTKWRVRKTSGGASVGFPVSSANVVGRTDGVAPAAGMAFDFLEANTVDLATATTGTTVTILYLPVGVWYVSAASNSRAAATQTGCEHRLIVKGADTAISGKTKFTLINSAATLPTAATFAGRQVVITAADVAGSTNYVAAVQYSLGAVGLGCAHVTAERR